MQCPAPSLEFLCLKGAHFWNQQEGDVLLPLLAVITGQNTADVTTRMDWGYKHILKIRKNISILIWMFFVSVIHGLCLILIVMNVTLVLLLSKWVIVLLKSELTLFGTYNVPACELGRHTEFRHVSGGKLWKDNTNRRKYSHGTEISDRKALLDNLFCLPRLRFNRWPYYQQCTDITVVAFRAGWASFSRPCCVYSVTPTDWFQFKSPICTCFKAHCEPGIPTIH